MQNDEIVKELEAVLSDLRGLTLVTAVTNLIEKIESLKAKLTSVTPPVETTPVVEPTIAEPVTEAVEAVEAPIETPVEESVESMEPKTPIEDFVEPGV